jgi:cytochrome c biogenesis protein CcmG/thiol:disulfide interchange protein DsbE
MIPIRARKPEEGDLPAPTLDASNEDFGRIGYGRYARFTPLGLALVILAVLIAIAVHQRDQSGGDASGVGQLIGQPAPGFALTTFDGKTVQLDDYRGSVVVLNFWAQWCEPCKQEMPAFESVSKSAAASGEKVEIIGVNIKNDTVDDAKAFAASLGITYPVGHDVGPGSSIRGLIESSYGMGGQYPATVFIRPNGKVALVHYGPMTTDEMRANIAKAASS